MARTATLVRRMKSAVTDDVATRLLWQGQIISFREPHTGRRPEVPSPPPNTHSLSDTENVSFIASFHHMGD